jgi:hypothetical protein
VANSFKAFLLLELIALSYEMIQEMPFLPASLGRIFPLPKRMLLVLMGLPLQPVTLFNSAKLLAPAVFFDGDSLLLDCFAEYHHGSAHSEFNQSHEEACLGRDFQQNLVMVVTVAPTEAKLDGGEPVCQCPGCTLEN